MRKIPPGKDGVHSDVESSATVALAAGAHPIKIRYFQGVGGQTLRLDWSPPDGHIEEMPASALTRAEALR